MKKTILIIEDDVRYHDIYKASLDDPEITFLSAFTLAQGEKLFTETPDIDLIIIDGAVDSEHDMDSLPLIEKIRKTYKGHMIAASGSSLSMKDMRDAGCDLNARKHEVAYVMRKLFHID